MADKTDQRHDAASAPQAPLDQKKLAGFGPKKSSMARLAGRKSSGAAQRDHAALRQQQPAGHAEQLAQKDEQLAQKDEQLAQQAEQLAQQAAQLAQAAAIIAQQAAGTMLRWPSCSLSTILGRDCRTARTRWTG